jgi:hypothetical protein
MDKNDTAAQNSLITKYQNVAKKDTLLKNNRALSFDEENK